MSSRIVYILSSLIIVYVTIITYNTIVNINSLEERNLTYYKPKEIPLRKDLVKMFNDHAIYEEKDILKADIYLPSTYTSVEEEYKNKIPDNKHMFIHAIKGCDMLVNKLFLANILKNSYKKTLHLIPETFDLKNEIDIRELLKLSSYNVIVLKKNIQRQQGLKFLYSHEISKNNIIKYIKEDYVVAQRLLTDPYIIDKRKINIRYYLLLVIENNITSAYIYKNGFIYYTKTDYKYSTDFDSVVTTGYIDRKVYDENPLTHKDLYKYIYNKGQDPNLLKNNVKKTIYEVIKPFYRYLSAPKGKLNYQLFGVDIQPDTKLNTRLIEINKGPSTIPMDNSRDSKLKIKLQTDIYKTINVFKDTYKDNEFELIRV